MAPIFRFKDPSAIEFAGIDAIIAFMVVIAVGMANRFIRASLGTFSVNLIIVPILLVCPHWELSPWIKQHALSLTVGIFVLQLILPAGGERVPAKKIC
jgi:hypothetical protein